MTKRIDGDLFARLMRLSARERKDILEFLGQSPVSADDMLRRISGGEKDLFPVDLSRLPAVAQGAR
ncbi:hypothetical protein N8I71_14615 [Roseibacterium sp. SDUM158016]|jgi:hypothetical protein|uniref:hypothetical protein n=1 Tax=Roseicyclus sediminis TaxID=2980997 RepID=UPI0021D0922D|nr:hypothetical protein [Roseibacterium sp. SDUM158016]MCU4654076.1 hypothetical protein [Roseibacterium sp. SDUM158016]